MARKKVELTTPVTARPEVCEYPDESSVYDNRHPGVMDLPNDSLRGARPPKMKMQMIDAVAKGEGKHRPDVTVQTANGTQHSKGQNLGQQRNSNPASAWAESKDWDGGNLSGM